MLYLTKTIFVYRFYKILVIEPTTEVKAESIGAPSVKEIASVALEISSQSINLFDPSPDYMVGIHGRSTPGRGDGPIHNLLEDHTILDPPEDPSPLPWDLRVDHLCCLTATHQGPVSQKNLRLTRNMS
jgi:hypothetical protein